MKIYKKVRNKIMERYQPLKFAKKAGVNFPSGGYIYMEKFHGERNHG